MRGLKSRCLEAMQQAYEKYKVHGAYSSEKLKSLHGWVADELRCKLGKDYEVKGMDNNNADEDKVAGKYYTKRVDISVRKDDEVIAVISIKFVMSNYRQNANNYLENQIGETVNLRHNNIVLGHLLCFKLPLYYRDKNRNIKFKKDKDGKMVKRSENIKDEDVEKYDKLSRDDQYIHAPNVQGIITAHYDEKKDEITRLCTRNDLKHLKDKTYDILQNKLNVEKFFDSMISKIKEKYKEIK